MLRLSLALLPVLLSGCGPAAPKSSTTLSVQLHFNGAPLHCSSPIDIAGQNWQLQQLQLYLSDFSLNNNALLLDPTLPHQQARLALLGSVCDNSATQSANWQVKFTRPLTPGKLTFFVAVPQSLNHQDPLSAKAPLNQSDMYWSWQQGYKYLRLELAGAQQQWALHLGASGCQSASPLRPPATACAAQNRPHVRLNYQYGQNLIFDLAPLLDGLALSADNHCMADPNRLSCQTLLPRLGIDAPPLGWSMQ